MKKNNYELSDEMLNDVVGGMDFADGDGFYYLKKQADAAYGYTFTDLNEVAKIVAANTVKGRPRADDDKAILAALLAVPGLLTVIDPVPAEIVESRYD